MGASPAVIRDQAEKLLRAAGIDREPVDLRDVVSALNLSLVHTACEPFSPEASLVPRGDSHAIVLRGAGDGRLVLVVPEQEGAVLGGLSVVHLDLAKTAAGSQLVAALSTTGGRFDELRAAITEPGLEFSADLLEALPVEDVLLAPVDSLASVLMLTT